MAMSGMRLGEALASSCGNLAARDCQYNVTETTKLGRFGPPKSGKGLIDLDETLVEKLEVHIGGERMRVRGTDQGTVPRCAGLRGKNLK
jgi:hypothetical protein